MYAIALMYKDKAIAYLLGSRSLVEITDNSAEIPEEAQAQIFSLKIYINFYQRFLSCEEITKY